MTKKHFIALAKVIMDHNSMVVGDQFSENQLKTIAHFCHSQNPRFDRNKWFGYIKGTNGPNGGKK